MDSYMLVSQLLLCDRDGVHLMRHIVDDCDISLTTRLLF